MNRFERSDNAELAFRRSFRGLQAEMWTALPGIVQSFDAAAQTCVVQPSIMMPIRGEGQQFVATALPLLTDCPVHFPSGGNCTLTFPVNVGDECLVVFSSRCIDSWWQSGGIQEQAARRMHDLSDGFVFVGFRSQPHTISNISTSATQLRSDDGSTYIELDPSSQIVAVKAPGGMVLDTPTVRVTGIMEVENVNHAQTAFAINGDTEFTGKVSANGKRIDDTHKHNGVQGGSSNSGPVV